MEVLPSSEECSPDWKVAGIGRQVAELVPLQEPGQRSPPLVWECDRIPGTPHHHTQGRPPYHPGDYVPRT